MLLDRFVATAARARPDEVALIEPRRSTSYRQLDALVNRFANLLVQHGVRRGDRVVIALENSAEFVGAYFGAMRAGAAAVPLPTGGRNLRLVKAIKDCAPAACLVDASTASDAQCWAALETTPVTFVQARPAGGPAGRGVDLGGAIDAMAETPPAVRAIDLDLAAIIYTSGSTADPRGVMLTHKNVVTNARSIVEYLQLTAADRVMCVLPFYYVYGLSLLHTHVLVGGSLVIEPRFAYPAVVLQAMQDHAVTGFAGVPSTFSLLLNRADVGQHRIPSLRYVTQAGGAMAPARIREWLERGLRAPFYVMYGATEASARLTYLEHDRLADKMGSIGRAIPNVELLVLRDDGELAAPGEQGELVARGANIACGYWNNADETAARFDALGYRTGDIGYRDEDGFLYLVGRTNDMIKVGAHRVGVKEIEEVLHEHPAVHEVAVVGAPDELLGEVPVAFYALRESFDGSEQALRLFCAERLPPFKVPVRFVRTPELPKIPEVGKIDRRSLLARVRAGA